LAGATNLNFIFIDRRATRMNLFNQRNEWGTKGEQTINFLTDQQLSAQFKKGFGCRICFGDIPLMSDGD